MNKVLVVARWEYLERVKSRIFLISLLLMPLIMIALGLLPVILSDTDPAAGSRVIAVADLTGELFPRLSHRLTEGSRNEAGEPQCIVRPVELSSPVDEGAARAEGDLMILTGEADGFCLLKRSDRTRISVEYRTTGFSEFTTTSLAMNRRGTLRRDFRCVAFTRLRTVRCGSAPWGPG